MSEKEPQAVREFRRGTTPRIDWDTSAMKSTYANACNALSTREEVILYFGVSNPAATGEPQVTVQLTDRIILNPHAAKRLSLMLHNVLRQYEDRFGSLSDDETRPPIPLSAAPPVVT